MTMPLMSTFRYILVADHRGRWQESLTLSLVASGLIVRKVSDTLQFSSALSIATPNLVAVIPIPEDDVIEGERLVETARFYSRGTSLLCLRIGAGERLCSMHCSFVLDAIAGSSPLVTTGGGTLQKTRIRAERIGFADSSAVI